MKRIILCFQLVWLVLSVFSAQPYQAVEDEESPRARELVSYVESEGVAAIPRLRGLAAAADAEPALRVLAIRHLGILGDGESGRFFRRLVLEILDPEAAGAFGEGAASSPIRAEAAAVLNSMGEKGLADLLWEAWSVLPPARGHEIPRLLWKLGDPLAQERMIEIMNSAADDEIAFQAVVELRRNGDERAIPALKRRLAAWRARLAAGAHHIEAGILNRRIRYTEGTIRALERR